MKKISVILLVFLSAFWVSAQNTPASLDLNVLVGNWKIDMSPWDKTDSNFASMKISEINENSLEGEFYRDGVAIRNGNINTQTGTIYAALISGDGTGEYNTTFYYKDGMLYGTTHAVDRNFLAVWTASKND